jgi:hypothetical protein
MEASSEVALGAEAWASISRSPMSELIDADDEAGDMAAVRLLLSAAILHDDTTRHATRNTHATRHTTRLAVSSTRNRKYTAGGRAILVELGEKRIEVERSRSPDHRRVAILVRLWYRVRRQPYHVSSRACACAVRAVCGVRCARVT